MIIDAGADVLNRNKTFAPRKGPGKYSFQFHMSSQSNHFENFILQVIGKYRLLIWESSLGNSFTLILTRINTSFAKL